MNKNNINCQYIRESLEYNEQTGKLTWRYDRPRNHFKTDSIYQYYLNNLAGNEAGSLNSRTKNGYTYTRHNVGLANNTYVTARVIWCYMMGHWPKNQIDHIDGNSLNNRWINLRDVTQTVNSNNLKRFKNNTSGINGVYEIRPKRWRVQISIKTGNKTYSRKNLGTFSDKFEAICVRKSWEASQQHVSDSHGRR